MKGADVAMSTIVQYNDWLEEEVSSRPARAAPTGERGPTCETGPDGLPDTGLAFHQTTVTDASSSRFRKAERMGVLFNYK